MFTNTLDNKPLLKKDDGETIRDLTQTIFNLSTMSGVDFTIYKIPKDFEMRADLISQAVYNNTDYAEFILKYNGISNPFTINYNDIILVPNLEQANAQTRQTTTYGEGINSRIIRNTYKYIDPTKIPKKDPIVNEYNNREFRDPDKLTEGSLPPNITKEGENNITYRNGRVYFGENIGNSACLTNGMTSSEFLTKVIKST
jgi:hypothetical protein